MIVYSITKDKVKCLHSSIGSGSKTLAFPSYHYEGIFMPGQVVELKSAYYKFIIFHEKSFDKVFLFSYIKALFSPS